SARSGRQPPAFLHVNQEQRDRRGRHARDARGLADVARPDPRELLAQLVREPGDATVVEIPRQHRAGFALLPLDLDALALDIARVVGVDREAAHPLLDAFRVERGKLGRLTDGRQRGDVRVTYAGPAQQIIGRGYARQRSSGTNPSSRPTGVRRKSALSSRKLKRNSARLVNMR